MATLGLELYMPDSKACVLTLPAAHLPRAELPGPAGLLPILYVDLLGLRLLPFESLHPWYLVGSRHSVGG